MEVHRRRNQKGAKPTSIATGDRCRLHDVNLAGRQEFSVPDRDQANTERRWRQIQILGSAIVSRTLSSNTARDSRAPSKVRQHGELHPRREDQLRPQKLHSSWRISKHIRVSNHRVRTAANKMADQKIELTLSTQITRIYFRIWEYDQKLKRVFRRQARALTNGLN